MLRSPGIYTGGGSVGSVGIDVYTVSGETDLLGKKASELMEGITVEGDTVTGMLNYVTGYTGFHGSDPEEQEGNYLALLFRADGYQLSASHSGGSIRTVRFPWMGTGFTFSGSPNPVRRSLYMHPGTAPGRSAHLIWLLH